MGAKLMSASCRGSNSRKGKCAEGCERLGTLWQSNLRAEKNQGILISHMSSHAQSFLHKRIVRATPYDQNSI